jgi:predicted AlkP superfamily phosphohydrolase/phosphomutase
MRLVRILIMATIIGVPVLLLTGLPSCSSQNPQAHNRVIVLGLDGFDPRLCNRMMDAGELPNFARLRDTGGFKPLGTSIPPQSPVAWASFITGENPGGHGIYDFVHREPNTPDLRQFYSAAKTEVSHEGWEVGKHRIPLTFWPFNQEATETVLTRGGVPFWDRLDAAGVPVWLYNIPANYPPSPSVAGNQYCLAGMGVPDLLGSYGTYQFFAKNRQRPVTEAGGMRKPLRFNRDHVATAKLVGPVNSLLQDPVDTDIEFQVYRHPKDSLARIEIQDKTIVLKEGEWSDWQRVAFKLEMPNFLPNEEVTGLCRFYLQQVRPDFRLYVSPINIDPMAPSQAISEPPEFVTEISEELGMMYTSGFQEEYNALKNSVFSDTEYLIQADDVLEQRMRLLDFALERYEDGLLFFYYSSTDLQAHMFWWDSDEPHPTRTPAEAQKYMAVIKKLYRDMDDVVGRVVDAYGDKATILVMSDHGFCNFRRQVNINNWLRDNGYLVLPADATTIYDKGTDWSRTRAYSMGLNGIYLNLKGREYNGFVTPEEKEELIAEITAGLQALRDPDTGEPCIVTVYRGDEIYSGDYTYYAPDLVVGFKRNYRASWNNVLGGLNAELFSDNDNAWSADHCIAASEVPGVIFANKPIQHPNPSLIDLAPTLLDLFGVEPPDHLQGHSLFSGPPVAAATTGKE